MSTWTLSDIRRKVRQVTGRFTSAEMTNAELDKRINQFYNLRFPADVKLEQKHTYYSFQTSFNQPYYDAPLTQYTNFEPRATVNNFPLYWYQDPIKFETENQTNLSYTFSNPWTGDGATITFTTTVGDTPIYPGTLTITDNTETFEDTNKTWTSSDVAIVGSLTGTATINYNTGAVSVTFNAPPANGQLIYLNYILFKAGRPQAILYYNNQFQLYPVPDQLYLIKMKAYQIVTPLVNATDTPDLSEWGPAIAYGTSLDIFADYGENDAYAETLAFYKEQVGIILTRTVQDLLNVRSTPQF